MSSRPARHPTWRTPWFLWTLLAVGCWGVWAVLSKLIGSALSAEQSQAASTLGMLPVLIALGASKRLHSGGNRNRGIFWAFLAGFLTCLGNIGYYQLLRTGAKASTVVPLTALYPLVTLSLAVVCLRERLNWIQGLGVMFSLAAIYLFNVPGEASLVSPALVLAVTPIALWGLAGLLQKVATNHISGELGALAFLAAFVPVGIYLAWQHPGRWSEVSLKVWLLVSALGMCFAVGNFALLEAFARDGKASVIAPLAGLYPVVSVPIAILVFKEQVGSREVAAIGLALLSVGALSLESPRSTSTVAPIK